MRELFSTILYEPLFNFLIWLYHVIPGNDLGVAIIILTLVIKLVLFWPALKALRSQKALQEIQPKIEELRTKYADDKEELGRQIMQFYKENKVNPFSSCLPLLVQLPVLWALFRVFFGGLDTDPATGLLMAEQLDNLYSGLRDIYSTTPINTISFGVLDLSVAKSTPGLVLAVLAGLFQFLQTKMLSAKRAPVQSKGAQDENMAAQMNKQMMYVMPVITIWFGYTFPLGVTLYWLFSTLFTWVQQLVFLREKKKMNAESDAAEAIVDTTAEVKEKK